MNPGITPDRTPGKWDAAWRLYHAARELPADQQRTFVESHSADAATAELVFELLASLAEAESEPPEATHEDRSGTMLGRYRVAEFLGRGGAGEVYSAQDMDLGRLVALKFLRPEAIGDPAAVKRFLREAKAASSLNHPNLLTIHEVIDSNAGMAIAMELVRGRPLNELRGGAVSVAQVVKIGNQAAGALAAAHEEGIVHRDIKPENLMLRPDGLLKVLDFGLARGFGPKSEADRLTSVAGSPSGTLRYMSPEQLRGEPLTGASDVYSLGLVLYELAAGQHPFASEYAWETAHKIHTRDPERLSISNGGTPAWLDDLLARMLNRDPALRPAAREVEAACSQERPAHVPAKPLEASPARTKPARTKPASWALGAAAFGLLLLCAWLMRDQLPFGQLKARPFTDYPGDEDLPAFSPDGRQVAFVWDGPGHDNRDIYVRAVGSTSVERITTSPLDDTSPAWSPAGTSIAFLRKPRNSAASSIYIVPASGGPERKILDITLPRYHDFAVITWTPDGKWLIAPAREAENDPIGLFRISPEDGSKLRLTRPPPDQTDFDPAISPNGRMIAFTGSHSDSVFSIYLLPLSANFLAAGEPRVLPSFPNLHVGTPQWTPDGKELLFVANPKVGMAIWRLRVPENGEAPQAPRREMYSGLSSDMKLGRISGAARRLIYSSEVLETNVWRVPLQNSGTPGKPPVLQSMGSAGQPAKRRRPNLTGRIARPLGIAALGFH